MHAFDLTQSLPADATTLMLEASAGTGKTFTISVVYARYVMAGVEPDAILAVTYGRMATAELRSSIRERLIACRESLQNRSSEPVIDAICEPYREDEFAAQRISTALENLDTAPIMTLHGFAVRMLNELGILADHDDTTVNGDASDLKAEVIADLYLARRPSTGYSETFIMAQTALDNVTDPVSPADSPEARFVNEARREFDKRKRVARLMDYNDMIVRLRNALVDDVSGELAATVLSDRYHIVLVDEFQDTDTYQWDFLQRAFDGRSVLMLIGDPKQAIYRFRGGDIETYQRARDSAKRFVLDTNYRSDEAVVRGIESLFIPVPFTAHGDPITLNPVKVAHTRSRISTPSREACTLRVMNIKETTRYSATKKIRDDLVAYIGDLMGEGITLNDGGPRPLSLRDIAVLVATNQEGRRIRDALSQAGIAASFQGNDSVLNSPAAHDWKEILTALADPSGRNIRRAALTSMVGWTSARLATASEPQIVDISTTITEAARLFESFGVAAAYELLVSRCRFYERFARMPNGEELLTDLRHIMQLLNEAQRRYGLTPAQLIEFCDDAGGTDDENATRKRRLSTEHEAVTVMTYHRAKGLQFPVVLLPQAAMHSPMYPSGRTGQHRQKPQVAHVDGWRVLDIGQQDNDQAAIELAAESLRTFYVACTRAKSKLTLWWAPIDGGSGAPLHRLLMNRGQDQVPRLHYGAVSSTALPCPPGVYAELVDPGNHDQHRSDTSQRDDASLPDAAALPFQRMIDTEWTRTSYSGLTLGLHDAPALDEVDVDVTSDVSAPDAPRSELAELVGGTRFGTLVHETLELVDPAAGDVAAAIHRGVEETLPRSGLDEVSPDQLVRGLIQVVTTPLGELTDGASLADLGARNRMAELGFEIPLRGGHQLTALATLFDELPADDPLHRYGEYLAGSPAAPKVLSGFLTGSLDVLMRVGERYVVMDYKTNKIPTEDELTSLHYSPAAMTDLMIDAHYPLQALIYSVATHHYLSWRIPDYDPERNLGGVGYLFVRGMTGPNNPIVDGMPTGVFTWFPPARMVVAAARICDEEAR